MLLVSISGVAGWVARGSMMQASPGGLLALAEEAADSYNVYAPDHVRPVEIRAADNAQLVQWVSSRLHQPVNVPDLTHAGLSADGRASGRHLARSGSHVHVR